MSALVPADEIERIVGTERWMWTHFGRAVSAEQTVYILHSIECKNSGGDLRKCPYSIALDRGICEEDWSGFEDLAVAVGIRSNDGRLFPVQGTEIRS